MSTQSIVSEIKRTITNADVPLNDRAGVVTLLAAEAVARCINIPNMPVTDPRSHFNIQCYGASMRKLGEVNEFMVMDLDKAIEKVYQFWLTRYRLVHLPDDPSISRIVLCAHGRGNLLLDQNTQALLTKYCLVPVAQPTDA